MQRFANMDRLKPLTGLDYLVDSVFQKCSLVAPPVVGSAQKGLSKCSLKVQ